GRGLARVRARDDHDRLGLRMVEQEPQELAPGVATRAEDRGLDLGRHFRISSYTIPKSVRPSVIALAAGSFISWLMYSVPVWLSVTGPDITVIGMFHPCISFCAPHAATRSLAHMTTALVARTRSGCEKNVPTR